MASFPADVCPDITDQFGCGHREKFRPSVSTGGRGRGGGAFGCSAGQWVWPKDAIHPFSGLGAGEEVSDK